MNKLICTLILACASSLNSIAQVNGFFHFQNTVTGRYISINDTDTKNYPVSQSGDVNMGGIRTYINYDSVCISPSCILFVKTLENGYYDFVAQGSSLYQMANRELNINLIANSNGSYKISGTARGITKILADGSESKKDSWLMNRLSYTQDWWLKPINTGDEYIGIKPDVKTADGNYYGTIYMGFNFKLASAGMAAYYVSNASGAGFTLTKIEEEVIPAGIPVIIKCNSMDPKDNKIELVVGGYEFSGNNWLGGVYCSIIVTKHRNVTPYDPATMRVIGLSDKGELAFVKAKAENLYQDYYLFGNKAYLKVGSDAADVLTEGNFSAINKVMNVESGDDKIYTLTGVCLPEGATPQSGVYIKNGKKIVIK